MRLIIKTTLLYLLLAFFIFSIAGIFTYKAVIKEVQKETDYYLNETLQRLSKAIEEGKPVDALTNDKIVIRELTGTHWEESKIFSDTLGKHPYWDRLEPHRKLTTVAKIGDRFYFVSLMDVLIEFDDMYEGVVGVLSRLLLFLSLAFLTFSFLVSKWLFRPFQKTLQAIESFNLESNSPMALPSTKTREFRMLNNFIQKMSTKAKRDYRSLKEFTENASHEIQTPIAIAKGRLELLLETPGFKEEQVFLIQSAHESISKLSRIGQSLGLLAKIDNLEFSTQQATDFSKVLLKTLHNFEELASLKGIEFKQDIQEEVSLKMDSVLTEILVTNLLKNAIQHNVEDGWAEVVLTGSEFIVRNTGTAPKVPTSLLFERFRKDNQSGGSLGLGLAIAKKICEANNLNINYDYSDEVHQLRVIF